MTLLCGLLCRSYDEQKLSDDVLERCGSHSGILHIGTTADAPVRFVAVSFACYLHVNEIVYITLSFQLLLSNIKICFS